MPPGGFRKDHKININIKIRVHYNIYLVTGFWFTRNPSILSFGNNH